MFSPMAVPAKMITWVAIDMFASEPSWVNGKAKATTKADRISTLRCRWVQPDRKAITPVVESTAMMAPMKPRKETNDPPSSMLSANATPKRANPIMVAIARISIHGFVTIVARFGARSASISLVPTKAASAPTRATHPPYSTLTRPSSSTAMLMMMRTM